MSVISPYLHFVTSIHLGRGPIPKAIATDNSACDVVAYGAHGAPSSCCCPDVGFVKIDVLESWCKELYVSVKELYAVVGLIYEYFDIIVCMIMTV